MLIQHVKNHNRTDFHQIPLLFPTTRRTFTRKTRLSTIDILYRCIDALPRSYATVSINHHTGLTLPLLAVLYPDTSSPFQLPLKTKDMTVANVFQFNQDHRFLHWKDWQDTTLRRWKLAPKRIFQGIQSGDLLLQPFFRSLCVPTESPSPPTDLQVSVSFSPFVQQLKVFQDIGIVSQIPTKTFREACASSSVVPAYLSTITKTHWLVFWRLSLTMVQRNLVYRFLNNCIPHKARLHSIFPDLHPSDLCSICSSSVDSAEHFLFHCPAKASVWQGIIFLNFYGPLLPSPISLWPSNHNIRYSQRRGVPVSIIVFITLANIWRCHFRAVFDHTPFTTVAVLASIRLDILTRVDEDHVLTAL